MVVTKKIKAVNFTAFIGSIMLQVTALKRHLMLRGRCLLISHKLNTCINITCHLKKKVMPVEINFR